MWKIILTAVTLLHPFVIITVTSQLSEKQIEAYKKYAKEHNIDISQYENVDISKLNLPPINVEDDPPKKEMVSPKVAVEEDESSLVNSDDCKLFLESNSDSIVEDMLKMDYVHVIKYNLFFPEYDAANRSNPLLNVTSPKIYKLNSWYHAFTSQGSYLLSLSFNYDVMSLTMLPSGVKEMKVGVTESFQFCFAKLNTGQKVSAIFQMLDDVMPKNKPGGFPDKLCYQKVEVENSRGKFVMSCCDNVQTSCLLQETSYMKFLHIANCVLKLIFFLMCPLVIQKLFYNKSVGKFSYVVPINRPGLKKTMLIKRVHSDYESVLRPTKYSSSNKPIQQFSNFRRLVKPIPSEEIVAVSFCRLDLTVNHSELISKQESPVQFLQYFYSMFFRCECGKTDPFKTCCGESLVGSWSPNFLWCHLQKKCNMNNSCRECCPWYTIFKCFTTLLLIALLPLPFYIRVIMFYLFEKSELDTRHEFLDKLNLDMDVGQILFQGISRHACYFGLFLCYGISFGLFVILKALFPDQIKSIVSQCVNDFKNLNRFECMRMILAHLVLPFEKFGVFGLLIGMFYWPIVMPIVLILSMIYCVPILYIIGRLIIKERPSCLGGSSSNNFRSQNEHSISREVSSLSTCFFLDQISPKDDSLKYNIIPDKSLQKSRFLFCCYFNKAFILSLVKSIIIGLISITIVLSLSVMYAEAFGFLIEMAFLSLLGAFLNTKINVFYLIFASFCLLHLIIFFFHIKRKYSKFSYQLFETLQLKLRQEIFNKLTRCKDAKEWTAFKFFQHDEILDRSIFQNMNELAFSDGNAFGNYKSPYRDVLNKPEVVILDKSVDDSDNIEYINGKLHWTINSLVLFIDGNDVMRIPRDLFWRACHLQTPYSPGPLWKTLVISSAKLILSCLYLTLLLMVILFYEDVTGDDSKKYEDYRGTAIFSAGMQVMFIFICGLLPSIIYVFYQCCNSGNNNKYDNILGERLFWEIKSYRKSWAVSDLVFENPESPRRRTQDSRLRFAGNSEILRTDEFERTVIGSDQMMPLKVDLLITLKDEPHRGDPSRASMISNGSVQSLTSVNRNSPEEKRHIYKNSSLTNVTTLTNAELNNQIHKPLLFTAPERTMEDAANDCPIELNEMKNVNLEEVEVTNI
ncbi:hypothetical protein HELRODRAFT_161903 [Helobdella robusta]|uniref:Uncharacterized protein n=1 Tax=Helobdella robusta TaxID=6412 RepID=T1ES09_HELRO|nr:hypothetical protein HELRODRAFT_161903 [Helobdella robusta]ESO02614.1 hypothetical protein HELRODRAFT_161903 [Helobdella robusta]